MLSPLESKWGQHSPAWAYLPSNSSFYLSPGLFRFCSQSSVWWWTPPPHIFFSFIQISQLNMLLTEGLEITFFFPLDMSLYLGKSSAWPCFQAELSLLNSSPPLPTWHHFTAKDTPLLLLASFTGMCNMQKNRCRFAMWYIANNELQGQFKEHFTYFWFCLISHKGI